MEWSYSGETGPECWSGLCPDFKKAEEESTWQSPIPLTETAAQKLAFPTEKLTFNWKRMLFETDFFNHTIHLSPMKNQEKSSIVFNQKKYVLDDVHAHLPSEHVIDEHSFELEIHFVHRSADNEVLVIGVMVQSRNKKLKEYLLNGFQKILTEEELKHHHILELNLKRLKPENSPFFHYQGSLTTPPTIGTVQWVVMKNPISLPAEFVEAFKVVIGKTNRPLQAILNRNIMLYES